MRARREPDLAEGVLAEIADWRVRLADADVAVRVHDPVQFPGAAGHDLPLRFRRLDLGPLQHRLDARAEPPVLARLPAIADVPGQVAVRIETRPLEGRVLAVAANEGQIVMVHLGAAIEEIVGEPADLVEVLAGCRRNRVPPLQLREGVVGLHRAIERRLRAAELVVVLARAVERQLADEKPELRIREQIADGGDGLLRVPPVGRDVDLARAVVFEEQPHDLGELTPKERLASRQVERLDRPEVGREPGDLVKGQIVALIEIFPIEAVLAFQIADRVDEQD